MKGRLAGRRALIWGGGSGLGLACAAAMREEGAAVAIAGRDAARLEGAATGLGGCFRAAGDATSEDEVERVTGQVVAALGGLDTVVISAGTGGPTPIDRTSLAELRRILDGNLLPVFLAARAALPHLLAAGGGALIPISSMYGLVGQRERVAYCAAKAGVIGMVRAMALDLADRGVRVNAICPGFVETELARAVAAREPDPEAALRARRAMHPIPRAGTPEEVGRAAVYLASDDAAWMTGQCLTLDGGYTAR